MEETRRQPSYVPARTLDTEFPLIDSDPHFKRVCRYARPSDYGVGAATAAAGPGGMWLWERVSPSYVGKGGFAPIMRLTAVIGLTGGFLHFYSRSISRSSRNVNDRPLLTQRLVRFYGFTENQREREMDMREMVDKVKKNEPLYGKSSLSPHMQGVASRNSRYAGVWLHVIPWFNFVNHEQVCL
ncbi:MAG: hypothetical protein Q9196_000656 [Gyalolechia fulgens]